MFKVYIDDTLIYDSSLDSLMIFDATVNSELNCVGSFEFTIYPNHPYFSLIQKLKPIVKVVQDGLVIFKGRILNDVNGNYNEKKVTCESDLSFLLDSVQRPYFFEGTPAELFTQLINSHNEQVDADHRFKIGNITVTDPNDYINRSDSSYLSTWESIQQKLIDGLGGYLWVRYEEDGNYIDYVEDFNVLSNQTIEFGQNLIDIKTTIKADDIFTVIIPLGSADEEGNKLDIKSVNDGLDYLEHSEGISQFGRIVRMVEWSDVTLPENLKRKAQQMLDNSVQFEKTLELSSADLSGIKENINSFHLGTKVRVISKPHNIDLTMLVQRLSIDILNPANNKLELGSTTYSMSDIQTDSIKNLTTQVVIRNDQIKNEAIHVVQQQIQSDLEATSESIMASVSEQYYLKGETDELVNSVSTQLTQTSESFEFRFDRFSQDLEALANGTDAEFENIRKYIRFEDGKIKLGEVGNSLELQIANDRIRFMQNNSEVAYFSNNRLYVVDGEFTNSLQLGKYAFLPRTNGNLSFKKVRE